MEEQPPRKGKEQAKTVEEKSQTSTQHNAEVVSQGIGVPS